MSPATFDRSSAERPGQRFFRSEQSVSGSTSGRTCSRSRRCAARPGRCRHGDRGAVRGRERDALHRTGRLTGVPGELAPARSSTAGRAVGPGRRRPAPNQEHRRDGQDDRAVDRTATTPHVHNSLLAERSAGRVTAAPVNCRHTETRHTRPGTRDQAHETRHHETRHTRASPGPHVPSACRYATIDETSLAVSLRCGMTGANPSRPWRRVLDRLRSGRRSRPSPSCPPPAHLRAREALARSAAPRPSRRWLVHVDAAQVRTRPAPPRRPHR